MARRARSNARTVETMLTRMQYDANNMNDAKSHNVKQLSDTVNYVSR